MKKAITIMLVLCIFLPCLLLIGCDTKGITERSEDNAASTYSNDLPSDDKTEGRPYFDPKSLVGQIPENVQYDMLEAYVKDVYGVYAPSHTTIPAIVQNMSMRVFGIFDDVYVFFADGLVDYEISIRYEEINGIKIWYPNNLELVVFSKGSIYSLKEAVGAGVLSNEDFLTVCNNYFGAYPNREKTENITNNPVNHSAAVLAFYLEFWEAFTVKLQDGYSQYCHFEDQSLYEYLMNHADDQNTYYEVVRMQRLSDELWVMEFFVQSTEKPHGMYNVHYVGILEGEYRVFLNKAQIPAVLLDGVVIPNFTPYGPDYVAPGDLLGGV